jgi:hypothetical protein
MPVACNRAGCCTVLAAVFRRCMFAWHRRMHVYLALKAHRDAMCIGKLGPCRRSGVHACVVFYILPPAITPHIASSRSRRC